MFLFNRKQKVKRWLIDRDFIEAKMTEQINTASKLVFSVPLKKRLPPTYFFATIPQPRGSGYLLFKIISEQVQSDRVQYTCVEAAYDELKSYHYIKDDRPQNRSAADMLRMALDGTRWGIGTTYDAGTGSTNFYYISSLEAIQKIANLFQLEVVFSIVLDPRSHQITRRLVNLYAQQGQRTGKRFEYGSNLLSVEREESSENLITALIGRGKGEEIYHTEDGKPSEEDKTPDGYGRRINFADVVWSKKNGNPVDKPAGQEYVEDPDATAAYGFDDGKPRIGIEIFEDITDPGELLRATWSALQALKRPRVSFKANVMDVGDLGLGDTVAIIRHDIKIEYFTRVYKVEHNLLNERLNTIELGDDFSGQSITSAVNSIASAVKQAGQTADYAAMAAGGKNTNYYGKNRPALGVEGDIWYKDLGNGETDMYQYHDGNWVLITSTRDLHNVQKQVEQAQAGLNQAKADIVNNKQKADADIEKLNKSIEVNKKAADDSLQHLSNSITKLQSQYDNNIVPDLSKVTNDVADALQKYISAQNSIVNLTKQAQQQGKNIADVTKTIDGLNINYANLLGDINSTKIDVKSIQTTLGNANGDIAQLKIDAQNLQTLLAGKVDNSTYTNFVNLTNQALQARLTASDLNGYAKITDLQATANGLKLDIDSVTDRMNNLKIGAVNHLRDTNPDHLSTIESDHTWIVDSAGDGHGSIIDLDSNFVAKHGFRISGNTYGNKDFNQHPFHWNGGKYVFSVFARLTPGTNLKSTTALIRSWNYTKGTEVAHRIPVTWTKWQKLTAEFDSSSYYQQDTSFSFGVTGAGSLDFAEPMLVTGNTPTDWAPSPWDINHNITQLSARITANSQQFSSYYTKSETDERDSAIKASAINTIKDDSNWTGLTNIITNSGFLQTADGFTQKVQQTALPMVIGGGINLLTGTSNNWKTLSGSGWFWKYTTSDPWYSTADYHAGDKFTYTICINNTSAYALHVELIGYGADKATRTTTATTDLIQPGETKTVTTTLTIDASTWWIGAWIYSPSGSTPSFSIKAKNEKLEKGSVATPWSPNPADLATQIDFSSLNQTVKGLQSTVSGNYGALQNQVSQTATTLRNEISNQITGVESQITTTANGINARIDNIHVGGRNLLHGTSDNWQKFILSGWGSFTTAKSSDFSVDEYHNGDQFTYSAFIDNSGKHAVALQAMTLDQNKKVISYFSSSSVPAGWQNRWLSVSFPMDGNTYYVRVWIIFPNNDGANDTVWVKEEQLEKGTIRTSWTPNPDDVSQRFTDISATIDGLQSTVGKNYGDLQSQIAQTATTLRGEVTNATEGLKSQLTQQSNNFNIALKQATVGGGVNLLRGTSSEWKTLTGSSWFYQYTTSDPWYSTAEYHGGDKFTYTICINNTSAYALHVELIGYGADKATRTTTATTDLIQPGETKTVTTTLTIDASTWWIGAWIYSPSGSTPSFSIKAKNEKLEKGSVATAWSPSPEDMVVKDHILAQINMSAGTTLIQNNKVYMDASSTIFSGNAFIPNAAITDLSADKITTGTLNAGNVNIINMNANNITTGTINGQNLSINLNSGEIKFQHGQITSASGTLNIDIDNARMSVTDFFNSGFYFQNGELILSDGWDPIGKYGGIRWNAQLVTPGYAGAEIHSPSGVSLGTDDFKSSTFANLGDSLDEDKGAELFVGHESDVNGSSDKGMIVAKSSGTLRLFGGLGFHEVIWSNQSPGIEIGINNVGGMNGFKPGSRVAIHGEFVHIQSAYEQTTGNSPNVFVATDGALVRSTSATKYKAMISRSHSLDYGERLLSLPTATWMDKAEEKRYASGESNDKPVMHFGMIAEDLVAAGLDMLVSRGQNGELEGIQYDRIGPALLPVIKNLQDRIEKLEEKTK